MTIVCLPLQRTAETAQPQMPEPARPRVDGPPARAAGTLRPVPPSTLDQRWLDWAAVLVTDPAGTGVALCLI